MKTVPGRRFALMTMGLGMVAGATGFAGLHDGVASAAEPSLLPPEAKSLEELTARLSRVPRRRDFKTVPMILNDPNQWDLAALSEVIAYRGAPKQLWDNTGIASGKQRGRVTRLGGDQRRIGTHPANHRMLPLVALGERAGDGDGGNDWPDQAGVFG